ncbi:hypothetical protein B4N89_45000 [Embleya scabrispora]|uniref:ParB-like N-terminal domain-containing protein n=1 Tax=Embleya scabrispora TaxID=159449 RepID=A0A1T3NJ68_9ACTN|nr:ParB N-terminal domain-containing protein [Embleya scabrispora]OPC76651.1 hypothetical protein B4N89_45000 [Embleya scabrispora]
MGHKRLDYLLHRSENLAKRRLELLPLRGDGAARTDIQGRAPGASTTSEGLADLISSISTVGLLHAVLVEEVGATGAVVHRLVTGERRLRAMRWGAVNLPSNPNFARLPAVVCPGPLTDEERRVWQLVENLAREDLQPGELARALLLERSALLADNLVQAGLAVPSRLSADPVARFQQLERLRGTNVGLAAPWEVVLGRLGLQLSPRRARELVSAFRSLPRELSNELDEHQVALHARGELARVARTRRQDASEVWKAVKRLGRPDLLGTAARVVVANPALSAREAASEAQSLRSRANDSRSVTLSTRAEGHRRRGVDDEVHRVFMDRVVVGQCLRALRPVADGLHRGEIVGPNESGSLKMLITAIDSKLISDDVVA